jgi:hypothetical protein
VTDPKIADAAPHALAVSQTALDDATIHAPTMELCWHRPPAPATKTWSAPHAGQVLIARPRPVPDVCRGETRAAGGLDHPSPHRPSADVKQLGELSGPVSTRALAHRLGLTGWDT